MISAWKIRREITRLGQQVAALHEALWEPWVQRRHDKAFAKGFPVYDGDGQLKSKVALFLIYQQGALPESIIETCRHVAKHGYSVLIVANGGLPAESRARLQPNVWRILERPNVGYDFGGYRDGILQLQAWKIEPDKLLILNDSIWFPIFENDPLLNLMEASQADVMGTVLRQKGEIRFLESYLYLIDGPVLKNEYIKTFWKSYRLTANKYKVIRRGERGHSVALTSAGYQLCAMYSNVDFMEQLASEDDTFLTNTLRFGIAETAGLSGERDTLLNAGHDQYWRSAVLDHIKRVLQSAQFYSAFPYASIKLMNYPILKKSSDMVSVLWRNSYLAAVEARMIDAPLAQFRSEIVANLNRGQKK